MLVRKIADHCLVVVGAPWFNITGFLVIVINAMALGLETYDRVEQSVGPALKAVEAACVAYFVMELLIRFGANLHHPSGFFRDKWNLFDIAVVAAPLIPGIRENVTLLRLFRLARIVRAFRLFPSLRIIVVGIKRSLPGLGSFLLITGLLIYGYAMLGWMMFGEAYPEKYGTVGQAMLTLFLLLSLDGITDTLEAGRDVTGWAILYYISYMVGACLLLTNMLIGVVLTALQEAADAEHEANQGKKSGPPTPIELSPEVQIARLRAALDVLEAYVVQPATKPAAPAEIEATREASHH
ncbi:MULTISPECIES: ion transporter [Actinoplanes]|uniref:ion transporter n=1 Tax=Actinoplanes TaxID=1865 RepID=UPI00069746CF|nr:MULTISPECIES: ion transporter [Actinoplanes]GLY02624.1 hypothetical protein Acsp01_30030 [Actinoplanes sp. NBRC 101535]